MFLYFHFFELLAHFFERPDTFFWMILWYIAVFIFSILSYGTVFLLSYMAFMIAAAPFSDIISEQVEGIEGTFAARPFSLKFVFKDTAQSLTLELVKVLRKLVWVIPLYLLSIIAPVVGQPVYFIFGGYKMAFMLGMDHIDWSLARRGYPWRDRFNFADKNRWELIGFGTALLLSSVIPLGFILFWPGAVAGGTLLCNGLNPDDRRKNAISPLQ